MLGNKDFRNVIFSHFLTGIAPQTQLQCSGPKIRELIVSQQLVEAAVVKIAAFPNAPSKVGTRLFHNARSKGGTSSNRSINCIVRY